MDEDNQPIPVQVGTLEVEQGLKYFETCKVGHPVFEFKDRYILYMKSEVELKERVYNQQKQGFETHVGFFLVAVPYYKETLKPIIKFL